MKSKRQIERLVKKIRIKPNAAVDKRIVTLAEAALGKSIKTSLAAIQPNIWRIIIKSRLIKIAASLVFVVGLIAVLTFSGTSNYTFADVISPITIAHTVTFDLIIKHGDQPDQRVKYMCIRPGRVRQELPDGVITIIDYGKDSRKILILNPNTMKAWTDDKFYNQKFKPLFNLDDLAIKFKEIMNIDNEKVKFLGKQEIKGRMVIGYSTQLWQPESLFPWQARGTFTVWAEEETGYPIQVELYDEMMGLKTMLSNILINLDLDEQLFNLEVPDDYTTAKVIDNHDTDQCDQPESQPITSEPQITEIDKQKETNLAATNIFEQKIIEGFRNWTELSKGKFPSALNYTAAKDLDPNASCSFKLEGRRFMFYANFPAFDHILTDLYVNNPTLSEEEKKQRKMEQEEMKQSLRNILTLFITIYRYQGDWYYFGKDATCGDPDTPIFWYSPEGSETYRVIYADLSVSDVAPDELPKLPDTPLEQ